MVDVAGRPEPGVLPREPESGRASEQRRERAGGRASEQRRERAGGRASARASAQKSAQASGQAVTRPSRRTLARAIVGGVDYAVGGWGEYEINRRRARWDSRTGSSPDADCRPGARYGGRTYISADDAVQSVLAGARAVHGGGSARTASALQKAALRLAETLGRLEDRLCDPDDDGVWECEPAAALAAEAGRAAQGEPRPARPAVFLTVPPVTSADLRAFAADPSQEADPEAMHDLGEDVTALVASVGVVLPPLPQLVGRGALPPLPTRTVPVSDDEAVLRLELATAPYVASLEAVQAALATRLDAAAAALDAALATK